MSKLRIWTMAAFLAACTSAPRTAHTAQTPVSERTQPTPPQTEQRPFVVRSPAGERQDEYYWLRDDTRTKPDVLAHLGAENAYKDAVLAPLRPAQAALYDEIVARMPPEDASVPVFEDGYWYQKRFVAGGEYPLYVRRKGSPSAPEELLLDGNELSKGHDFFRISAYEVSPDGQQLAWAEDTMGRLQHTIRFKNLSTGVLYPDVISNADSALAWANDHQTVLYIEKHPETLLGYRVRKHRLGTPVSEDALIYEERDPAFYLSVWKSRSERFLNIYAISTVASEQRVADASDPALNFSVLVPRERNHEYSAEDHGDEWILRTNYGAPNFRIVAVPMATVEKRDTWRDLVPEPKTGLVEDFSVFQKFLAFKARSDGLSRVFTQPWYGATPSAVPVPETASTSMLGENPEPDSDTLRFEYTSMKTPDSVYELDTVSGKAKLLKQETVLGGFNSDAYVTEYVKATALDGTLVPVSLVYARGVKLDGSAPLYQTGYGSYGASSDPEFSSARLSLLNRGVVFALAHIRGGQELGRAWYEQGKLLNKRNTFTDFIDVTDFLVQQGYAARERVVARGASAGGLLMGAIANMAPRKYRAIVAHVPFVDVVTTMLDESIPLTTNEFDEWGNPKLKTHYETMLEYSPYDNVRPQNYPALFVTTGLWDSQVQYYEPAKWVARLRARKTDRNPVILRINMDAGHGGKSGRFIRQEELAEEYAFVLDQLGVPVVSH